MTASANEHGTSRRGSRHLLRLTFHNSVPRTDLTNSSSTARGIRNSNYSSIVIVGVRAGPSEIRVLLSFLLRLGLIIFVTAYSNLHDRTEYGLAWVSYIVNIGSAY